LIVQDLKKIDNKEN